MIYLTGGSSEFEFSLGIPGIPEILSGKKKFIQTIAKLKCVSFNLWVDFFPYFMADPQM